MRFTARIESGSSDHAQFSVDAPTLDEAQRAAEAWAAYSTTQMRKRKPYKVVSVWPDEAMVRVEADGSVWGVWGDPDQPVQIVEAQS